MAKFKRRHISFGITFLIILSSLIWWTNTVVNKKILDQTTQVKRDLEKIIQNSSEIHRLWMDGANSKEWKLVKNQCLDFYKIDYKFDEKILRCNPIFIDCIERFSKNKFGLSRNEEDALYKFISKSNSKLEVSGYLFTVSDGKNTQEVVLENRCHEFLLEEGQYFYGAAPIEKNVDDEMFDNFGRKIYLDNRLVLNYEVNDWILSSAQAIKPIDKKEAFRPATHLPIALMEKFCASHSKILMQAHYFDAATFYQVENQKPQRSKFHWTDLKNPKDFNCKNLFSYECLEGSQFVANISTPSLRGLFDPMGGFLEAFSNPFYPELNLKASSMYFPKNSKWHQLGKRAKWNGRTFDISSFDFDGEIPETNDRELKVGFRCMREEW